MGALVHIIGDYDADCRQELGQYKLQRLCSILDSRTLSSRVSTVLKIVPTS